MPGEEFWDSSDSGDEWGTPEWIVDPLLDALPGQDLFDLDPANGAEPKPYAETRYTREDDGLGQKWFGHVWLNPPYGRDENARWANKVKAEWREDNPISITALIPNSTNASWFSDNYAKADVKVDIPRYVYFVGADDDHATFASSIVVFGLDELGDDYHQALKELGDVWYANRDWVEIDSVADADW